MSLIAKLKTEARRLKGEVLALYEAARHPGTPWYAKLFIVAIVAYALSPIDLIPDFIPVLGFLDEIILLPIGIALALKMIPVDVMAECRARATASAARGTRLGRIGAGIIVLLWLALIVCAGLWAHSAFSRERVTDALLGMSNAVPGQEG
ncbi:MAG TPA: YkvA family protein [Burkholderiales bacterium]|nr:YkvA family protein [Burkholderiales bacterium]